MALTLMYITNDLDVALIAEKNGVDRIWIDLEVLGKEERQKDMNTVKSQHSINDIKRIKPILTSSKLMVRVNPWNENSCKEIEEVIAAGADIIMLPMWKTVEEVKNFIALVNGRTVINLLLETKEAVDCIESVLKLDGIDEIHIGLNDLHLSYGLSFMFELFSNGIVDSLCSKIKNRNIKYGVGGVACLGGGLIPAENIIVEHYRLMSTSVILSRSFCDYEKCKDYVMIEKIFSENVKKMREYEKTIETYSVDDFEKNKQILNSKIKKIVYERGKKDV